MAQFVSKAHVMAVAREQRLDCALQIVSREGFTALTLDAVAKAAGVSPGGVIHHDPSKAALVAGMLGHHGDQPEQELDRRAANDPLIISRRWPAMRDRTLQHDPDPDWQLMSGLIVDGLMLWQDLGLISPRDPLFKRLIRRLSAMTSQPPARPTETSE